MSKEIYTKPRVTLEELADSLKSLEGENGRGVFAHILELGLIDEEALMEVEDELDYERTMTDIDSDIFAGFISGGYFDNFEGLRLEVIEAYKKDLSESCSYRISMDFDKESRKLKSIELTKVEEKLMGESTDTSRIIFDNGEVIYESGSSFSSNTKLSGDPMINNPLKDTDVTIYNDILKAIHIL